MITIIRLTFRITKNNRPTNAACNATFQLETKRTPLVSETFTDHCNINQYI